MDFPSDLLIYNFEEPITENEILSNFYNRDWKYFLQPETMELVSTGFDKVPALQLLQSSIASFLAFIQNNFTGPYDSNSECFTEFLPPNCIDAKEQLTVDSVEINTNVKFPELLLFNKHSLEYLMTQSLPECFVVRIWYLRYLLVHQKIVEEKSISLYDKFVEISSLLLGEINELINVGEHSLILYKLEIIQGFLQYKKTNKVKELLDNLMTQIDLKFEIDGVIGVRTKFQTKALPQLLLRINGNILQSISPANVTHATTKLPVLLKLDDEVRLEKVQFRSETDNEVTELQSIIQNIILINLQYVQISQPKDTLSDEELEPYLRALLYQSNGPWIIRIQTLLIKIKLESNHRRTIDRCLKQCEEIVNMMNQSNTDLPIYQRLTHFFASNLNTKWEVEAQLGELMLSLGLIKDALNIYLRLQMWEEVIYCYTALQLRHKAEEIIRQELEKKPTVKLYCLLGDATDNVDYYEKAWEFSNCRSSRAQRHWGNYYFGIKEYAKCIDHLEISLSINSLQEVLWLKLGFAALEIENWNLAASAYLRYTQLEPYGFESWNNLAKAYIKLGNKKRAHKILEEALKCNFNNWKIWENYLIVSIDTGNFEDALNAYSRLLDLKDKYYDKEILNILVNAIANNQLDANGVPSNRLKARAVKMIGHSCVQLPNEGLLYEMSALLHSDEPLKKAQKLQQAYRCFSQSNIAWSKNSALCEKMLKLVIELAALILNIAQTKYEDNEKTSIVSQISSARLTAQGVARSAENENHECCTELVSQLKEMHINLTSELKKLM